MYDRLIYFKVWRVSSIFLFAWDRIFKDDVCLSKLCKSICPPCPNHCLKPQSKESDPSTLNNQDNPEKGFELSVREASSAGTLQDTEGVEAKDEVLINCNFFGLYPYLCYI